MTEKELGQMHYLNREIEKLNEELSWMECKSMIKSPLLTGMPFGTGVSDKTADYAVRMEEIRELIDLSIKKLLHTRARSNGSYRRSKIRNSGLLYGFVPSIISDGRRSGKNLGWTEELRQGSIRDFVRRNLLKMLKTGRRKL